MQCCYSWPFGISEMIWISRMIKQSLDPNRNIFIVWLIQLRIKKMLPLCSEGRPLHHARRPPVTRQASILATPSLFIWYFGSIGARDFSSYEKTDLWTSSLEGDPFESNCTFSATIGSRLQANVMIRDSSKLRFDSLVAHMFCIAFSKHANPLTLECLNIDVKEREESQSKSSYKTRRCITIGRHDQLQRLVSFLICNSTGCIGKIASVWSMTHLIWLENLREAGASMH